MNTFVSEVKNIDVKLHVPRSHSHRKYQLVELSNGLRTFLINDRSSDLFSAAMIVGSGSANDPDESLGLAHLCEHMLFLGTRTYPIPNHLNQIVSSAGGFTNAYTTMEHTCYHFELSSFAKSTDETVFIIDQVLDIFSSFFKCPLFKEKYIKGEINAVEEEHRGNTEDMNRIIFHALRLLASPNHAFHRFGTGNKDTLSALGTKTLQRYLRAYFQRFYTTRKMVLVLKGPQSINHLKKLLVAHFSDLVITSLDHWRGSNSSFVSDHDIYFSPQLYGYSDTPLFLPTTKAIFLKVPKDTLLRLCYPWKHIFDTAGIGRLKSLICNLIGDESMNTVCDYLKRKKGWATDIMVFCQNTFMNDDVLVVDIGLTPLGLKNLPQVIDTLHYFVNYTVVRANIFDLEKVASDLLDLEETLFLQRNVEACFVDEICDYGEKIEKGDLALPDIVRGYGDLLEDGSRLKTVQQLRKAFIECFTEENVRIIVAHKDLTPLNHFKINMEDYEIATDSYYQYEFVKITESTPMTFINLDLDLGLELPTISSNLKELVENSRKRGNSNDPDDNDDVGFVRGMRAKENHPCLVWFDEAAEIWQIDPDGEDQESIYITVTFHLREIEKSPENIVGIELVAEIVGEELRYKLYHYELLGHTWGFFVNVTGEPSILVSVSGPKSSSVTLLQIILDQLRMRIGCKGKIAYQQFKRARVNTRKRIEETQSATGLRKVFSAAYLIIEKDLITPNQKLEALELYDTDSLTTLSEQLLRLKPFTQLLFEGDIDDEERTKIFDAVSLGKNQVASYNVLAKQSHASSYFLPDGRNLMFSLQGGTDDTANTVFYYLQLGPRNDLEVYAWGRLFEHYLSHTALNELRTKRRLAYMAFTGMKFFRQSFGIHITIPSGEFDCHRLADEIEGYLWRLEQNLNQLTEERFKSEILEPFIQALDQNANHINTPSGLFLTLQPVQGSGDKPETAEFMAHWSRVDQIINGTYRFGGTVCEEPVNKNFLQNLSLETFLQYVRTFISVKSPQRSCLIVANAAGTQLYEACKSQFATIIHRQLREGDVNITHTKVTSLLEACRDQEGFTDLPVLLKEYIKESKQNSKLVKLAFKRFATSIVRGATSKISARPIARFDTHPISNKTEFTNYKDIQNLCYVGKRICWHDKILSLESIAQG